MTITDDEHDLAFLHHHHDRLKNHNRQNAPSLLSF